jgi:NifU-like protein involved in Fe-S cluster formation
MNAPLYTTEILRLAASLSEPRPMPRVDGKAELRSPTCGSRVGTSVTLDESGRVAAISQQVHACAFGQASAAALEQAAIGRTAGEVEAELKLLGDWLDGCDAAPSWGGLLALAPARPRRSRHGAILLPFRALLAAMDSASTRSR